MSLAWLRRLHRWIGLTLALPMILLGITGFILALEIPSSEGGAADRDQLRIAEIIAAAREVVPVNSIPQRYRVESANERIVEFAAPGQSGATARVIVDPATLAVRTEQAAGENSFFRVVHGLHENFLLGPAGRSVVGWCGVGLLALALLGIPLWWPSPGRWKAAITVSPGAKGARLHRELHGAAGFWTVAMLLFQSASGIALSFPQTARALAGLPPMTQQSRRPNPSAGNTPDIAAIAAAALRAVPDAALADLRLPTAPGRPIVAILRPPGQRDGAPAAFVTLDAAGRVLSAQDPRTQSAAASALGWLRALHGGGGLGLPWRIAVWISGLVLPLFSVTGLAMWLLRQRAKSRVAVRRQSAMASNEL